MKKYEHFKKNDKIRETTSQMNPDIFYQHEIQCKISTFLCRNRTDKKTDRISNAISIKLDKLRLTVTVSAKVKSDYFFVLEKGSAMEEKWIIKDANDNRAYNSDKCC